MRALISVSDKTGLVEFASILQEMDWGIVSTGGTAAMLEKNDIAVVRVEQVSGHPEILGGRVKTLHPKIHGGILAKRGDAQHEADLASSQISHFDMVVVNLYPFEQTVAKEHVFSDAIEQIDIGGVALIRASAKNFNDVVIVTDVYDYAAILQELRNKAKISLKTKEKLAAKAFRLTASYDAVIEKYFHKELLDNEVVHLRYEQGRKLRYGENWHQEAKFFKEKGEGAGIANIIQHHGKELSYNNLIDADAALETVKELRGSAAVCVVKHTNPCGLATGETLQEAMESAWSGDTVSAFGSVIACSRPVDLNTAEFLKGKFVEMIIAPGFDDDALKFLKNKSKNIRILEVENVKSSLPTTTPSLTRSFPSHHIDPQKLNVPYLRSANASQAPVKNTGGILSYMEKEDSKKMYRHITGGMLEQDENRKLIDKWECITVEKFPDRMQGTARFTLVAAKHTKSNAVVLGVEYKAGFFKVLGMGAGQPNRVDSLRKLAVTKAQENILAQFTDQNSEENFEAYKKKIFENVVLASDAFFPFADTIETAAEYDIKYIVQPGGSIRDQEVIEACNKLGSAMIFTGMRHFRH